MNHNSLWRSSSSVVKVQVDGGYAFAMLVVGHRSVLAFVGSLHTTNLQPCDVVELLIGFQRHMETWTIHEKFIAMIPV